MPRTILTIYSKYITIVNLYIIALKKNIVPFLISRYNILKKMFRIPMYTENVLRGRKQN